MSQVIRLDKIQKIYHSPQGETEAVSDLSFAVEDKEFVSLIGPSGCGKSTVLSLIAGLETPSAGTISPENGNNGQKLRIGYMLQQDHLFPWLTVRQNALLGLTVRHEKTKMKEEAVDALLRQYGLDGFADAYPSQLSGGMRQRAALIRTLAVDPTLLLLDEPFSALDAQTRLAVSDDIHGLIKKSGKTALLVTHDMGEAISMSDRVIVLTKRPATVKAVVDVRFPDASTPLEKRKSPRFSAIFQKLWEELHDEPGA